MDANQETDEYGIAICIHLDWSEREVTVERISAEAVRIGEDPADRCRAMTSIRIIGKAEAERFAERLDGAEFAVKVDIVPGDPPEELPLSFLVSSGLEQTQKQSPMITLSEVTADGE
jgi:hypothetical protein